jgi:hypothetical protein
MRSVPLREERKLQVDENKVLKKMSGTKKDELSGRFKILQTKERRGLHGSPFLVATMKSWKLWAGHVARTGETRMHTEFW